MRHPFELIVPLAVVIAVSSGPGCGSSSGNGGGESDSGADQSVADSPSGDDTGTVDSGTQQDSSTGADTGSGMADTGAGITDTGVVDTSVIDANWKDTGSEDGGISDSGSDASDAAPYCGPVSTLPSPMGAPDAGAGFISCPGSGVDGGGNQLCNAGSEHCCENGTGTTISGSCVPIGTACTGAQITDWRCEDPYADCGGGTPVCCATGATLVIGSASCGNYATSMTGTTCVASGGCAGIQLCLSSGQCPSGKTCVPFEYAGNPVGACH